MDVTKRDILFVGLIFLAGFIFGMGINEGLQKNGINCSPLNFCVGEEVETNNRANEIGFNVSGVVVHVDNRLITIDTDGNENFDQFDEFWLRHIK